MSLKGADLYVNFSHVGGDHRSSVKEKAISSKIGDIAFLTVILFTLAYQPVALWGNAKMSFEAMAEAIHVRKTAQ